LMFSWILYAFHFLFHILYIYNVGSYLVSENTTQWNHKIHHQLSAYSRNKNVSRKNALLNKSKQIEKKWPESEPQENAIFIQKQIVNNLRSHYNDRVICASFLSH
jgi:hypothetical protein